MRRRLFTLLSALSLVLCVGVMVLTVRSFFTEDRVHIRSVFGTPDEFSSDLWIDSECTFVTDKGEFAIVIDTDTGGWRATADAHWARSTTCTRHKPQWIHGTWVGFYVRWNESRKLILFPLYVPLLILGMLPAIWLRYALKRRARGRSDVCSSCGYDLRATPDRCPECGTETKNPAGEAGGDKRTV